MENISGDNTWICEESSFLKSIKFPIFQNMGQPNFRIIDHTRQVIPPENIVRWCMDRMNEYYVLKITMDTYRYRLFKMLLSLMELAKKQKKTRMGRCGS